MEKKDLKHLSRSELVDVICEMKKDTTNSNDLTMEEIESEQKRKENTSHPPPLCFAQQNIGEVSAGRRG